MSNSDTDLFNQLDAEIDDLSNQMTLLEHLDEMRRRLTVVVLAIVIATVFSLIFAPQLVEVLARPLDVPIVDDQGDVIDVTPGVEILQSIEVTENISVFMRVSFLGGLILAMPIIFYQLIAFIVPGLTDKEKKFIMLAIPAATALFLGGVAFAYFVMLPNAVPFLISFLGIKTAPRPANYFSFATRLIFWIGVSFELPLFMALLARLGVLNHSFLITNARYAVVIIAVLAAFITPTPDPLNMGLVMAPLILLYGLGIILAKIFYRPRDSFVD
jgi:sec-independent protein translocase protein TatC